MMKPKAKRGFTLLELVIAIIIIAILASLGFNQYNKALEKGRAADAKTVLGQIRRAQINYKQEYGNYTTYLPNLTIANIPPNCLQNMSYFRYTFAPAVAIATRCTGGGGRSPTGTTNYTITINYNTGVLVSSEGY